MDARFQDIWRSEGYRWLSVRLLLLTVSVAPLLFQPVALQPEPDLKWLDIATIALVVPIQLLVVLAMVIVLNPAGSIEIKRPRWLRNPLRMSTPLEFFHLAAYVFLFGGAAILFMAAGRSMIPWAIAWAGAGLLAGVHLSAWLLPLIFRARLGRVLPDG